MLSFWLHNHFSYIDSNFLLPCAVWKVFTVHLTPEANNTAGDGKEEEAGWVERKMKTVDWGAQFAMPKSIKLHGGKSVLNTIKEIKAGKYINSKKKDNLRPSHAKYQELLTRNQHKKSHQRGFQKQVKKKSLQSWNWNRTHKYWNKPQRCLMKS